MERFELWSDSSNREIRVIESENSLVSLLETKNIFRIVELFELQDFEL